MDSGSRAAGAATAPVSGAEPGRLQRLGELVREVAAHNQLQRDRLTGLRLRSLDDLAVVAPMGKRDLVADQQRHPPFGTNLTYPLCRYRHLHQTSGTAGATLRILDTAEDWAWWRRCFAAVLRAAGIGEADTVALAHSFGPYVQFWASYEGLAEVGAIALALGGMRSQERLRTIADYGATALICTPSYALHLARVACQHDLGAALASVQRIVCTGEPGASMPAVRDRIEELWQARCLDHAGLSEVGSYGWPCVEGGGLHVLEDEFIPEVLDPHTLAPVARGELGELVVTALGRTGFPAIRYRTGDVVELHPGPCPAGHPGLWLPRGIVGRSDDMVVIRGMNVFPSAIEQCLRELGEQGEFRVTFYTDPGAMDEVKLEVELSHPAEARGIQSRLRQRLGLRIRIVPLKPGTLRSPGDKTRRVVDLRRVTPGASIDEHDRARR